MTYFFISFTQHLQRWAFASQYSILTLSTYTVFQLPTTDDAVEVDTRAWSTLTKGMRERNKKKIVEIEVTTPVNNYAAFILLVRTWFEFLSTEDFVIWARLQVLMCGRMLLTRRRVVKWEKKCTHTLFYYDLFQLNIVGRLHHRWPHWGIVSWGELANRGVWNKLLDKWTNWQAKTVKKLKKNLETHYF
jgi:hypothetical protein